MAWVFEYEAPKGLRFKKDVFHGISAWPVNNNDEKLWFCGESKRFKPFDKCKGVISSSGHGVNSVKAFKNYVNKKCKHMKNQEITLDSRIFFIEKGTNNEVGTSVIARWVD